MAKPIIEVHNVSKKYRIGAKQKYYSLRDSISDLVKKSLIWKTKNTKRNNNEIWALKDVSFQVAPGEVLGIIGRNGAGKTTLLKILSQITQPNQGKIILRGRVASLLEVGTGFHPELTGRENIFLNGAILGMTRKEIKNKFDEIVDFSEIEKFLDTPIKHYSSGMYMRLAFAVAAHLEPEILLVDEVLAVGDIQFQKKCLGKISDITKNGRTVIFVSHNLTAVSEICHKCILLDKGSIIKIGTVKETVNRYVAMHQATSQADVDLTDESLRKNSLQDSYFKFIRLIITNSQGIMTNSIKMKEPFEITIKGILTKKTDDHVIGFNIMTSMQFQLFNSIKKVSDLQKNIKTGKLTFKISFNPNLFGPGIYLIGLGSNGIHTVDWIPQAAYFTVEEVTHKDNSLYSPNFYGIVLYPCKWKYIKNV